MDILKEERNKTVAALKQKRQEDMKKLRTDYRKKLEDTRTRYQESREKAVDSRNRAKMREQVKKTVNELNHLLLDGDKKRHVPESMRKAVAEILSAVNMETSTAEARSAAFERTVARYNKRIFPAGDEELHDDIKFLAMGQGIAGSLQQVIGFIQSHLQGDSKGQKRPLTWHITIAGTNLLLSFVVTHSVPA